MGIFNKLFKASREGLIEAYLETYRKIKSTPLYQIAAEDFVKKTQMPKEFHYVNTAIFARRYKHYQQEILLRGFMDKVKEYLEKNNYLSERQMLVCLLIMAHEIESGDTDLKFESISNKYITKYFGQNELSAKLDVQNLKKILNELP